MSELQYSKVHKLMWSIIIMLSIALMGGGGAITYNSVNIGKNSTQITTNSTTLQNLLDETGVEFVARRVSEEKGKALQDYFNSELDKKVDKSAFIEFGKKLDLLIELQKTNN